MYKAASLVWRLGKAVPRWGKRLHTVQPPCWEGLGGGGGGLEGSAVARPQQTQQGTWVKWLFQPLLLVEAEPGADLAPAGFLRAMVHHRSLSAACL